MKDKVLRGILCGKHDGLSAATHNRASEWTFPAKETGDVERKIRYANDDGLILYFIKRIEKLEKRVQGLEDKPKAKK